MELLILISGFSRNEQIFDEKALIFLKNKDVNYLPMNAIVICGCWSTYNNELLNR